MENRVSTLAHKQKYGCLLLVCHIDKGGKWLFKGKIEKK
jgi:hypothetical protein